MIVCCLTRRVCKDESSQKPDRWKNLKNLKSSRFEINRNRSLGMQRPSTVASKNRNFLFFHARYFDSANFSIFRDFEIDMGGKKKVAQKKDNHISEIDKSDKEGCIFVQKTPELKKSLGQAPAFRVLGIFNRYRHPCEILSQRASIAKSGLKRIYLSINHDIPRKLEGVWRF